MDALAIVAETVGGIAANLCIDTARHAGVGQKLDVSYPERAIAGSVRARSRALVLDGLAHLWSIDTNDATGTWVANARLTVAIVRARPLLKLDGAK